MVIICIPFYFLSLNILYKFFYIAKDSGIFFGWWTPIYGIGVCIVIYLYKLVNKTFIVFLIVL